MPPRHLTSSQSDDARMEAGASLELMNNTRECTSKLSQTGNNNRQSTIPIKPREPSARCQGIFIFPLPLRATAHIPELKVKRNTKSYTPGGKKRPSQRILHCAPCLCGRDVFRAKEAMIPKARRTSHNEKMPPSACRRRAANALKPPLRKKLHPERRENNNQVVSDRGAKKKCGRFR
jgi:hypothetical protein